ncbi:MAG: glycosyltransferase [Sphingomicrobium sp.]
MKINYLDSGLNFRAGHHLEYARRILGQLAAAGHDVHAYGYAKMEQEVVDGLERFGISRLFRDFLHVTASEYDDFAGEIVQYRSEAVTVAKDLRKLRAADGWIWPLIRPQDIAACSALRVKVPMVGCVFWDPGVETRTLTAQLWRDALLGARGAGLNLTLASFEPEIRQRFMPIVPNGRFVTLPQPVEAKPLPAPRVALKRIGFFGHQREEKEARGMNALLAQLVARGFHVTFQNSSHYTPSPDVKGVEMIGFVDDLTAEIARCDLVVLPYDIERYHARDSGLLVEALALGIPVTAPFGTLPGRIIEASRVGPLFISNGAAAILRAVQHAVRNYDFYARNAHRNAIDYTARNNSARCAAAIVKLLGRDSVRAAEAQAEE